jgi:pimeloyl-ACP methyl ester carboxylesterase
MSISTQLGEQREVTLDHGTLRYRERGNGEPIVFVHGALVNGDLWRKVVPGLAKDFRCIAPDLPLGSHEVPMRPAADLSPTGLARLISDFLEALDLESVTLVGNDTGGALCQLVVTRHPGRVGRLVLTNCDAYENFPPRMFRYLQLAARVPGGITALTQSLRLRPLRRTPIAYGWLSKRGIDDETLDSYVRPLLKDPGIRRDSGKLLRGLHPRYTLEAANALSGFERPVLIAWAPERDLFPWEHAKRLAATFPNARLERIDDSWTFIPEDQPERLAELIGAFAREPAATAASRS